MRLNYITISLLVLWGFPAAGQMTVAQQVARLKIGRKVRVELNSGETLKGRIGSSDAAQFTLNPQSRPQGTTRVVLFSEARSVRTDGLTPGEKWAIFGVIWVVVGIVAKLTV
jgi:hypothetical protein